MGHAVTEKTVRKLVHAEPVETEALDPEEVNPVYKLTVTISPKPLEGRATRSSGDTCQLWDVRADTLTMETYISRQKRQCFFESHEHLTQSKDKFYAPHKDEVFVTWPDKHFEKQTFSRIITKDALRKFMVAFSRRWPEPHQESEKENIEHQYEKLLAVCDEVMEDTPKDTDKNPFNVVLCRDWIRSILHAVVIEKLSSISINERWQIVNCFYETCAFIKAHDEAPVFCLEAAGRDDFVVTTYGFAPQQHALFPGVPLQLQSATDLQYTLLLTFNGQPERRLVMLDPSLPGDAEE